MSIKHAILGLLADGPLHGYGLKAAYEESLVPGAALNIGQVYPALDKLQADGQVTVEVVTQQERPDRKVYTLTDAGRRELEGWLATATRPEIDLRNESFLKIVLAWRLRRAGGRGDPLDVIDAERSGCVARLHELTAARDRAVALPERLLLEMAVTRLSAFHRWLDRCEELIREEGRR